MRARVRVGLTSRRSSGATRSGLIENSSGEGPSSLGPAVSPACICRRRSGSIVMVSVSTVAEAATAPAMISPWVRRLCTRASMRPCRNWVRERNPTRRLTRPARLRTTMRRVRLDDARSVIARQSARARTMRRSRLRRRGEPAASMSLRASRLAPGANAKGSAKGSGFLETVADAVERLDHVEALVDDLELLSQPLDVAVDGAVVHVDLIVVGRVHQGIAALHDAG